MKYGALLVVVLLGALSAKAGERPLGSFYIATARQISSEVLAELDMLQTACERIVTGDVYAKAGGKRDYDELKKRIGYAGESELNTAMYECMDVSVKADIEAGILPGTIRVYRAQ